MPQDHATTFEVSQAGAMRDLPRDEWDACIPDGNPFVRHDYMAAMEDEGVAVPAMGYAARHVVLRDRAGVIAAAVPLYLKDHSQAEFSADLGWAMPHNRAVGPYYPKLQSEPVFCPLPGPRLLMRPDLAGEGLRDALVGALCDALDREGVSSLHLAFLLPGDQQALAARGFACGTGIRFVWANRGYRNFEDFLSNLASKRRGMIRGERRKVAASGLEFDLVEGSAITPGFIEAFFPLYLSTYEKHETPAPLPLSALQRLRETMSGSLLFTVARRDGILVAAVMFMFGGDTLYALHWGASIEQHFLHFELTYYRAISLAIDRGFAFLDGSGTGMHKVGRGLAARESLHAHRFRDPGFHKMIAGTMPHRRAVIAARIADLNLQGVERPPPGPKQGSLP